MKLPRVMGLVFCEEFDVRSFSLRGLFQRWDCATFPSPPQQFAVYVALYAPELEGKIELSCVHLLTECEVHNYSRWIHFLGRGQVVQVEIPIRQLVFPEPGRYAFRFKFEGVDLTERYLDVFRLRVKHER